MDTSLREKPNRIGLLGGTFNPVHYGHLLIAEAAREALGLEKVIFIPSGQSYMKTDMIMADAGTRLVMTRIAIQDNPFFDLSEIELLRSGNTYTCETLEQLTAEYPDAELVFIVGADNLFTMEKWKHPEQIFEKAVIAAAVRDDKNISEMQTQIDYLSQTYGAKIHLLPVKSFAFSSTEIRAASAAGKSIRYMAPEAVRHYISDHKVYEIHESKKS